MILLTVAEIVSLHEKLVSVTSGSHGIRDIGLIESSVYNAIQSFADEELYKTIEEKAARLAFSLTNNHAFIDGNKRIGIFAMLMTLKLNGVAVNYTQQELIDLGLGIASGDISYTEILEWIYTHK